MRPVVEFADIVAVLIDHLGSLVDPAVVRRAMPDPVPDQLVRVRRTGGPRDAYMADQPIVAVECYAATAQAAADLAETTRSHLMALRGATPSGVTVYRVDEVGGPADLPDPTTDRPRFTFTVQLKVRGAAA